METHMSSNTAEIIRLSLEITLEKMTLSNYTDMLRSRINKGYMPSSIGAREFNTKPYYETVGGITNLTRGTGFYKCQDDYMSSTGLLTEHNPIAIQSKIIYFGLDSKVAKIDNQLLLDKDSVIKEMMIITDLSRPITHTYVNVMARADNSWLGWTPWIDDGFMTIPVNPYELKEHLDIYT
jgi:hypothetical protein